MVFGHLKIAVLLQFFRQINGLLSPHSDLSSDAIQMMTQLFIAIVNICLFHWFYCFFNSFQCHILSPLHKVYFKTSSRITYLFIILFSHFFFHHFPFSSQASHDDPNNLDCSPNLPNDATPSRTGWKRSLIYSSPMSPKQKVCTLFIFSWVHKWKQVILFPDDDSGLCQGCIKWQVFKYPWRKMVRWVVK